MAVLKTCADHGIQHFTARVHASDLSTIHLLERYSFITVDGILTFSLDITDAHWPSPPAGLRIRLAQPEDIEHGTYLKTRRPVGVYSVSGQPAWEGKTDGGSGADG